MGLVSLLALQNEFSLAELAVEEATHLGGCDQKLTWIVAIRGPPASERL